MPNGSHPSDRTMAGQNHGDVDPKRDLTAEYAEYAEKRRRKGLDVPRRGVREFSGRREIEDEDEGGSLSETSGLICSDLA
jgi:hypothetical protein